MDKQTVEERELDRQVRLEENRTYRSEEMRREYLGLVRWFLLSLAILGAGARVGEGLGAQGERAVQRNYNCQVEFQKNQLERLFREPGPKEQG